MIARELHVRRVADDRVKRLEWQKRGPGSALTRGRNVARSTLDRLTARVAK